jgi:hypothetical protein
MFNAPLAKRIRDDLCCLAPNVDLDCWENRNSGARNTPNFVSIGRVKNNEGYPQAQVRLADIDGDGQADYVAFEASGQKIGDGEMVHFRMVLLGIGTK